MTCTFNRKRGAVYAGVCVICKKRAEPGEGYISDERDEVGKYGRIHVECLGKEPAPGFADVALAQDAPPPSKDELSAAAENIVDQVSAKFLALVPDMVTSQMLSLTKEVTIQVVSQPKVSIKLAHKALPDILTSVLNGGSPFLVGPTGSGKTTLAEQISKVLKRKFYMAARVTSEYKLVGFIDAQGRCVRTQFREAYEHGGVFLFDEVDASDPDALTAFNAALANGLGDFPDGMVSKHKDFVAIAAGNTFGRGADRQYVGRNQLDAATLDRFQTFEVDYDEELELAIAGDADWTRFCQKVRKAIEVEKVRHIVSPRASIVGSRYLAAGMDRAKVEEVCVWKGLDAAQRVRVMGLSVSALRGGSANVGVSARR